MEQETHKPVQSADCATQTETHSYPVSPSLESTETETFRSNLRQSPVLSLSESVTSLPLSRVSLLEGEFLPYNPVTMEMYDVCESLSLAELTDEESSLSERIARVILTFHDCILVTMLCHRRRRLLRVRRGS